MTLLVECVGLPGSGKSHLAARITGELGCRAVPHRDLSAGLTASTGRGQRLLNRTRLIVGECAGAPRQAAAAVDLTRRSGQRSRRDMVSLSVNWLNVQALARQTRRDGAVGICDQGPVMALWSTGMRGDASRWQRRLADPSFRWLLPDVLIVLDTDIDDVAARLLERTTGQSRMERLAPSEIQRSLQASRELLDDLTEWWSQTVGTGSAYVRVRGVGEPIITELIDLVVARS